MKKEQQKNNKRHAADTMHKINAKNLFAPQLPLPGCSQQLVAAAVS
jgi:hypothetical protein